MDTEFELKRQKSKEKELTRLFQCLGLQYTGFFILTQAYNMVRVVDGKVI